MEFIEALQLLLSQAREDHGGSRRCAAFLLSLWNGSTFRADLQELLYVDEKVHDAMQVVFHELYATNNQLYTYVTEDQMKPVIAMWGDVFRVSKD